MSFFPMEKGAVKFNWYPVKTTGKYLCSMNQRESRKDVYKRQRLMFPGGQGVEQFGVAFCNAGFIGIPLVSQLLGEGCLFYLTIYLTVMPLFVWTVGLTPVSYTHLQADDQITAAGELHHQRNNV